jgi:thermostable 8-oxoguanine DNA glycosylase
MFDKLLNLKNENQNKGREITKNRYHNNKDELLKKRREEIEKVSTEITKKVEEIEKEQSILEEW